MSNEELLSGVLILDKAPGMTSHDAVNKIRRLYGTKQVGHTGTLDPMATGVLPILVGRAVKASEYLTSEQKKYTALLQLGISTDTEDTTGKVLEVCKTLPKEQEVFAACRSFEGTTEQMPPMYSALKVCGQKLCDLARKNIEVERSARPITIYEISSKTLNEETGLYELSVHCSKGTYIRTLCADIGKKLLCGGAMAALRRTASGCFSLENAVTLESLEGMNQEERRNLLLPVVSLFENLPVLTLPPFYRKLCSAGCPIYLKKLGVDMAPGARVRLYAGESFFALGEVGIFEEGIAVKAVKQFLLFRENQA